MSGWADTARGGGRLDAEAGVAEMAGLQGAFSFPERLLQQIWARGDFDARALRLRDGRAVKITRRGRWNHVAGPDFAEAEINVLPDAASGRASEVLRGAVEVHLRGPDWDAHRHSADRAYDGVVLHVVLFPSMREWTEGAEGRRIPILELLPVLGRDLEAYAEEAAVEGIAGRPYSQLREIVAGVAAETLRQEIRHHSERRWAAKVQLGAARLARLGWAEACHQSALEVLGYRPNRAQMLAVAECWPWEAWRRGEVSVEAAWATPAEPWQRAGVRPANHPRARLGQYAAGVAARPDWPARLAAVGSAWGEEPPAGLGLRLRRRVLKLTAARQALAEDVCGGALGGSRLETWICDAALSLLAARFGGASGAGFAARWSAWTPGDAPTELLRLAREFQVGGSENEPLSQGDLQGLLGWLAALAEQRKA
jgi:hypothetical protein